MSEPKRVKSSEYMKWAKTSSTARFNLATSGLSNLKLTDLRVESDRLEITTEDGYGYPPLLAAISTRLGVPQESIVTAAGTSFANHLAMAALIEPGDEVLFELPTYEPLLALAHYLGAKVKRFERRFEEGFNISLERLQQAMSVRTRLIVLTNLNNPTGVLTDAPALIKIGELAQAVNARVLVDEVYLETFFAHRPRTAFLHDPVFITTSSLTKAFGLSGLRCGWIVAEPELAREMWRLNDLFASSPVHIAERLSVQAFEQMGQLARWAEDRLNTNRILVNQFLETREDLRCVLPVAGTVYFPRLERGTVDQLCSVLLEKFETSVVPGRFFELPNHFRLGIGGDPNLLAEGLNRLGQALDAIRKDG